MNLMRIAIIMGALLLLLVTVLGCGGSDCEKHNIVKEYVDQQSRGQLSYLTIKTDGTYSLDEGGMITVGIWELDCNTVKFSSNGSDFDGEVESGMITDDYGREWIGYFVIDP